MLDFVCGNLDLIERSCFFQQILPMLTRDQHKEEEILELGHTESISRTILSAHVVEKLMVR